MSWRGEMVARDNRGSDLVQGVDYDPNPQRDGSYTREQLWRFMWDIRFEPSWRREAEVENAYYDNDQLQMQSLIRMKELGIPPIQINMIAPAIDSVAGWEVITRADLQAVPETEASYHTAMGLNVKFKEAQRLTRFNQRVGIQFKTALKTGVSWLEIKRNRDPYGYPYQVLNVPWREIYWDYRSREPDLSDVRFIVRRKWFDGDVLMREFPEHREVIKQAMAGHSEGWLNEWEEIGYNDLAQSLANSLDAEQRFTLEEDEWRQQWRGRVALYEILYFVPTPSEVLRFRDGMVVELDRNSPLHLEALRRNMAIYTKGVTKTWRQAFYVGPHRLGDWPLETNMPHYIPMVAYRKDSDGAPYGLIRRMKSPQEAVNARYSRMLYDLSSRKYAVDDDAVDSHEITAEELNKVNSYIILKGDRRGEAGIQQLPSIDTSAVTYQLLQEAKMNIYDVTGLHPEFQGRTAGQAQSGVAIESLIEQTTQVLGVVVDNYRNAKTAAGQLLMAYLVKDIAGFDDYEVETDEKADGKRETIVLNSRRLEDGLRNNDVLMVRMQVALSDAPSSVTYQQQKFQSLVEVVKSMPEEMQVVMMDLIVRAASLPDGEEMLERIRGMTGYGPEPRDPEKREQLRQKMQEQQALQEMLQRIEVMLQQAELRAKNAKADLDESKAEKTAGVDTSHTEAETIKVLAEADTIPDEQRRKERETDIAAVEAAASLQAESRAEQEKKEAADEPAKKTA